MFKYQIAERQRLEAERERRQEIERERAEKLGSKVLDKTLFPVQVNNHVVAQMGDRWFVVGMSGAGKTTWSLQLIPRMLLWYGCPIYILDSKGQGEFNHIAAQYGKLSESSNAPGIETKPGVYVWQPPLDNLEEYDKWLGNILKFRKPCVIIIDELSNLGRGNAETFPNNYKLLLKQARGLKITIVSMVQEVAYIPRQVAGQSSHMLRFHLLNDYDRLAAAKIIGIAARDRYREPPLPFGFFYRRLDKPSPIYQYVGWQEFFPEAA